MIVNGKQREFSSEITIEQLINELGVYNSSTIVIVNGRKIDEKDYDRKLDNNSDVKILTIIGGG